MVSGDLGESFYVCRYVFFFSSRRRHTRLQGDWSSDVCSSDLPNAAQLEAINQGKSLKDKAFLQSGAQREWSGGFLPPVNAPVSDVFGTRRTFNAAVQSVHKGLDYAVPAGTPVFAVNSGTVILAHPLFFEGNCVVLDHGQGLLTLYLHLSEITVKEGDHIARGQQIGISGATGRATGAHLHVAVRWQGVYLNPATLFSLHLPRT